MMIDSMQHIRQAPLPNSYWIPDRAVIAGEYPGSPNKDEARSKLRALLAAGVTVWVDLTEDRELTPYDELLRTEAAQLNISVSYIRLPIADVSVPDASRMAEIVNTIEGAVRLNRTVYVHCWGGAGRTGTVVPCYLVSHGESGESALRTVAAGFATMSPSKIRRHPEGSPQTTEQRDFVAGGPVPARCFHFHRLPRA